MSSDTLTKVVAPEDTVPLRIVPQRRLGRWTAAVLFLVLLGLAVDSVVRNEAFPWGVVAGYVTSASVLRGLWLTPWLTAVVMALGTLLAVQDRLYSVQLVHHRTDRVIPLPLVATLWYVIVTSVLGVGRYFVEKHHARGSERTR